MAASHPLTTQVDQNLIKFSQACTIILLALGFVADSWVLVALAATCQLLGALGAPWTPYHLLYTQVVRRTGLISANLLPDHAEPHRFASLVGGLMNVVGAALLLAGSPLGWLLAGIVFVLANLNLWVGFCLGCTLYYQFNRLGVPGFAHAPVERH